MDVRLLMFGPGGAASGSAAVWEGWCEAYEAHGVAGRVHRGGPGALLQPGTLPLLIRNGSGRGTEAPPPRFACKEAKALTPH